MTRTMLVTGASGRLGREVLPAALAAGYQVRAVSRNDRRSEGVAWYRGDLVSGNGLDTAVDGWT